MSSLFALYPDFIASKLFFDILLQPYSCFIDVKCQKRFLKSSPAAFLRHQGMVSLNRFHKNTDKVIIFIIFFNILPAF